MSVNRKFSDGSENGIPSQNLDVYIYSFEGEPVETSSSPAFFHSSKRNFVVAAFTNRIHT